MGGWRGILGFDYGVVQAPLGPDIASPELVAAVANAGAIGLLRAPDSESPDVLRKLIARTRALTSKPFGVGVVLAFPHEKNVKVVLEERVAVLQVYWGDYPARLVNQAHELGVKVVHQEGLVALLPRVVDLASEHNIPVIAAGGIVDARGYVAALALGAKGVCMGTRFVAATESYAHPTYKEKILEMVETEYTNVFGRARWPGAPHRVLKTPFFIKWRHLSPDETEVDQPIIGHSTVHELDKEIRRFAGTAPNEATQGDIDSMVMYAGQGVGLIKEILPAGDIVRMLVDGAQLIIQQQSLDAVS
ncbi:uncharacterized protein LOC116262468 isoform X2 [Nymphaea colorata]|uniref:uncharacterized protein LOC116262468 isoform X2 n=1 Tax=Nymphaea colorata TaxID=210225 RepID=UPI00129EF820|nr:uncharacterized protein LOC116262468 isoform X2 [Nymphaea colorata]